MYQHLILSILIVNINSQDLSMSLDHLKLSKGMEFSPTDRIRLVSIIMALRTSSLTQCVNTCMDTLPICRMFEYDLGIFECRLFEDDTTTGEIIPSANSSQIVLGMIDFKPEFFQQYGQPCSQCYGNRFLKCINATCQCSSNSYFDGTICKLKRYTRGQCNLNDECRLDYNITCLRFLQCGPVSIYNGDTVAGYVDGTLGNDSLGLHGPAGFYVIPNGDLYVTDAGNSRVQLFTNGSLFGKTVAGNGINGSSLAQLSLPITIYVNILNYDVYVADNSNQRVQLWSVNATVGRTVAGGSAAILGKPAGVRLDSQGNLYISENSPQSRILRWLPNSTNGSYGTLFAGNGSAGSGAQLLSSPRHLDIDINNQYIYVADNANHRIQRFSITTINSTGVTVAGGNGSGSGPTQLKSPRSVCISKKTGALFIADTLNHRVQRWTIGGTQGFTIAGDPASTSGVTADKLFNPGGVALNAEETYLFVADQGNNRVQRFHLL